MIQRFNHIHGVGSFRDFNRGAMIPFCDENKVSIIFGRNTLGKTTLASIFESIGKDDPLYVLDRASLPSGSTSSPNIEIRYKRHDNTTGVMKFKSQKSTAGLLTGSWDGNDLKDKIYVFDQDFIHRHIMAGAEITRRNREEFTDFILGEEGVKLSQEIAADNTNLITEKTNLPSKLPPYAVKERMDAAKAEAFSRLKISKTEIQLDKEKETIDKSIYRLEKVSSFYALSPLRVDLPELRKEYEEFDKKLEKLLVKDFTAISEPVKEKVSEHIKHNCNDSNLATQWIKQGLVLKSGDSCPFCGQALIGAKVLLDLYEQAFNTEFELYDISTRARAKVLDSELMRLLSKQFTTRLNTLIDYVKKYEPYVTDLSGDINRFNEHLRSMRILEQELATAMIRYREKTSSLLDTKKASPHIAVVKPKIDVEILGLVDRIDDEFTQIAKELKVIVKAIDKLKEQLKSLTPTEVNAQLAKLRVDLKSNDSALARLKENSFCEAYVTALDSIAGNATAIKVKQNKLETDQSTYLEKYFKDLNGLFVTFGSTDFELSVGTTNKGKKKIYNLKVKYRGEEIKSEQLNKVFSESDKRSLALAIYFCKVSQLDNSEGIILVLDDPVVSFDDNRIGATTSYIRAKADKFRQVIILTHYKYLIQKIHTQMNDAYFLEIENDPSTSKFSVLDIDNFTLTPHEKDFQEISLFIEGDNTKDIRRMLRPYMEQHLRLRFGKQLADLKSDHRLSLGEVITELHTLECISGDIKNELDGYRTLLNPDHHITPTDENPIETRTNARNLFNTLYKDLV